MGRPVSQQRPGGPEPGGWGPPDWGPAEACEAGLTELPTAVGLPPGGLTTALVTAILTPSGWCGSWPPPALPLVVPPPPLMLPVRRDEPMPPVALLEPGEAEDDARDELAVTGH